MLLQPLSEMIIRGSVLTIHLKCANIDELMIHGKATQGEEENILKVHWNLMLTSQH